MQNSQTTPNTQQTKRYLNILVVQQMQMEAMTTWQFTHLWDRCYTTHRQSFRRSSYVPLFISWCITYSGRSENIMNVLSGSIAENNDSITSWKVQVFEKVNISLTTFQSKEILKNTHEKSQHNSIHGYFYEANIYIYIYIFYKCKYIWGKTSVCGYRTQRKYGEIATGLFAGVICLGLWKVGQPRVKHTSRS